MSVTVVMKNGTVFAFEGYASNIQRIINEARGKNQLIGLENCRIPTGQKTYFDPDEVVFVIDDR